MHYFGEKVYQCRRPWVRINNTLYCHLKTLLSSNLDQNMHKNAFFWKIMEKSFIFWKILEKSSQR